MTIGLYGYFSVLSGAYSIMSTRWITWRDSSFLPPQGDEEPNRAQCPRLLMHGHSANSRGGPRPYSALPECGDDGLF